ncbi:hypothetical protein [Aliikangiella sp. IMCC44359]|uniref:hypothetical protein n=1 Tax=Aliikangiella sp. IMCC44359 TaxID=3459125 RepID=UPI00403AFA2C
MKKYLVLAMGIVVLLGNSAEAVEGYKNLKFGMSKEQVKNSNLCSFRSEDSGQVGVEFMGCEDLKFSNEVTMGAAFFINNKLLRFVILTSTDTALGLINALSNKYGNTSSQSSDEEFNAIDKFPNREAFMAFDNDTVYLKFVSNAVGDQSAMLIYTSPEYDKKLLQNQEESISHDL